MNFICYNIYKARRALLLCLKFQFKEREYMTVKEIIEYTDKLRPNTHDAATKLAWINHVEGMVQSEIMNTPIDSVRQLFSENDTVSVKHPYSQVYSYYIIAMIDFFSGDIQRYKNSAEAYNDAMKTYAKYVARGGK